MTSAAGLHVERREGHIAQERAEVIVALSSEHGFPDYAALGTIQRGGALIVQEQWEEGIAQVRQGLEAYAGEVPRMMYLAWLATGYGGAGQMENGLEAIAEALRLVDKNDERWCEAEVYRLYGELSLRREERETGRVGDEKPFPHSPILPFPLSSPEACFHKAIEIARQQQAKSLELRAVMSLSRLWQRQGKQHEAHKLLAEIYGWFTEGFDTKDLQEAKALLQTLQD